MTSSNRSAKVEELLKALREEKGFVSGERLGEKLGLTRASVWKMIRKLKEEGYTITSKPKMGYALIKEPEALNGLAIKEGLKCALFAKKVHIVEEVDSTNTWAFREALKGAEEGEVFLAETQTKGKGRLGRTWFSPLKKNVYMSLVLRPKLPPRKVPLLGLFASLAVAEVFKYSYGLNPLLKWPNDVLVNGKKICGILTEAFGEAEVVAFVVLGIGINVNVKREELPLELRGIATSLNEELGHEISRNELVKKVLEAFEPLYLGLTSQREKELLERYRNYCPMDGSEVLVEEFGQVVEGIVEGIDEEGALVLRTSQGQRKIFAGDVKVKRWASF